MDAMMEQSFLTCAQMIGVDARIAGLILDCDRSIETYPEGADPRWLWRLEDQRRRLLKPDLRLVVAVTTRLAEETPALAPFVAAALKVLAETRPDLRAFEARLLSVREMNPPPRPVAG